MWAIYAVSGRTKQRFLSFGRNRKLPSNNLNFRPRDQNWRKHYFRPKGHFRPLCAHSNATVMFYASKRCPVGYLEAEIWARTCILPKMAFSAKIKKKNSAKLSDMFWPIFSAEIISDFGLKSLSFSNYLCSLQQNRKTLFANAVELSAITTTMRRRRWRSLPHQIIVCNAAPQFPSWQMPHTHSRPRFPLSLLLLQSHESMTVDMYTELD